MGDKSFRHVAVGDLDGDGIHEVIVPDCINDRVLALRWGEPAVMTTVSDCPTRVELDDIDDDGALDAAVLSPVTDSVILLRGNGLGGLGPW